MKVAMIFPTRDSEKAISGYSVNLVEALNKNKVDTDEITYTAGSPRTLFRSLSRLKKYDLVHIQHEYNLLGGYGLPFFFVYFYFLLFKKYKVITTMHTALPLKAEFKGSFIKTFLRKLLYFFQNRTINKASDLIFVHANFFVPVLVRDYNVPQKKIIVLPQGIMGGVKITPKNKAKKELNLSGHVYLIIANLHWDKGADIIIKQADKIGKTVLVVSSPIPVNDRKQGRLLEYIDSLQNYVKENNLSEYVRFDIKSINDQMPKWWKYFSAADFVLQAYRGGIGSGIFTHAMAAKKPVISSNIPFFKEISEKYGCIKTARTLQDYPELIHNLTKPINHRKMVRECERYLKENSWLSVTKKYKKIYSSLIK
jgi:glycosyltransferase involved in cell wall biosynthesis